MPVSLTWEQVALRLLLSLIAGAIIGLNREGQESPAGLRTNILVCLAACIAMLQANLLMNTTGKASNSFVVLVLMRLPLGILSGIGFIGAGAILRKGDRIAGVTTAATLWFVTVMGLCFGGGQIGLGASALILSLFVLWFLKSIEKRLLQEHHAEMILTMEGGILTEDELRATLKENGYKLRSCGKSYVNHAQRKELRCRVSWEGNNAKPQFIDELAHNPYVITLEWHPSEAD